MKTITKLQLCDDGMAAALFFFCWYISNKFFRASGNDEGMFMESYCIRLPFNYTIQYRKHSKQKKAIVSVIRLMDESMDAGFLKLDCV